MGTGYGYEKSQYNPLACDPLLLGLALVWFTLPGGLGPSTLE